MIAPIGLTTPQAAIAGDKSTGAPGGFGAALGKALDHVNALQNDADAATLAVADGTADNLHDMSIALAKADVALQMTVAVRNRAVEAYQQIMHMQI